MEKGIASPFFKIAQGQDLTRERGYNPLLHIVMFLDPSKPIDRHRVNLPHWQQGEAWLFVTWRLADSLPVAVVKKLDERRKLWEGAHPKPWGVEELKEHNRLFTLAFEELLDDAHGSCALRDPALCKLVADAILHFHGERYMIDSFVVMPNHVHVLFHPTGEHKLEDIVGSWKRFSARGINKVLEKEGTLWQRECWDRLVRSERHFKWARDYIRKNPEKLPAGTFLLWQYGEGD
jgi:type I restriction enzyme R subunit